MNAPVIETENLVKTYPLTGSLRDMFRRERKQVLSDIDLQVDRGQILGLLGPNGAGKSTLIKILSTLVRPTSGVARVDGFDVIKESAQVRGRIGLVNCDDRSYYWRLTARENLEFYAALNRLEPGMVRTRIDELLELTGLSHATNIRLSEFSSGMKQRLAIARGLLARPSILFMDEPSRSLDPIGSFELWTFIRENVVNAEGRTVILATNIMDEAEFLCDRVALINQGRIHAQGTVEELNYALRPDLHYRLKVTGLIGERLEELLRLEDVRRVSVEPVVDDTLHLDLVVGRESSALPRCIRTIVDAGGDIWECRPVELSLDEVFRQVLGAPRDPSLNRPQPSRLLQEVPEL